MMPLELTLFSVTAQGVIVVPDIPEPKTRADVFEQVDLRDVHSRQDLIDLIRECHPLAQHFGRLSRDYLDAHTQNASFVDTLVAPRRARSGSVQLIVGALRRDPEDGWQQWIDYSGDAALEGFLQTARDWLDEDINWGESDYFDAVWNGQAAALSYFDDLPAAILKAVGIRIVEGDVPGATYRAAELYKDITVANQTAELLELEFRLESINLRCVEVCND